MGNRQQTALVHDFFLVTLFIASLEILFYIYATRK